MKIATTIAASFFTSAAVLYGMTSALAGTDDGNVAGAYTLQAPRTVAAGKESGTAAGAKAAGTDFLRQQRATSGN